MSKKIRKLAMLVVLCLLVTLFSFGRESFRATEIIPQVIREYVAYLDNGEIDKIENLLCDEAKEKLLGVYFCRI